MTEPTEMESVLGAVEDPLLRRSLAELGMLDRAEEAGRGAVRVHVALPDPGHPHKDLLAERIIDAGRSLEAVEQVEVVYREMEEEEATGLAERLRGGDREVSVGRPGTTTRVLAIGSGKGGVGKSSVAANLAVSLASRGRSVGIIDADVWGFSIPKMLGVEGRPAVVGGMLVPPESHGVRVVSMDFFVRQDQAVIWRGPMLHKAVEQFLADVFWDDPEYLLVDMPPGTGDVAISLSQFLPRAQAVIVTTPQPTAQRVARRAALMAEKVNQEVLGVVENMSWFTGDDGTRYQLFGEGGGRQLAEQLGVPLLGQIPLVPALREGADQGRPVALAAPESEAARAFEELAAEIESRKPRVRTHPELVIR